MLDGTALFHVLNTRRSSAFLGETVVFFSLPPSFGRPKRCFGPLDLPLFAAHGVEDLPLRPRTIVPRRGILGVCLPYHAGHTANV